MTQVVQDYGTGKLNRITGTGHNAAGHVLQSIDPAGQTGVFQYNNLGQTTSASFPATASTPAETVSYGYGLNGRTESVTDNRGTTSMAYESGNDRVSSVTDPITGATGYTYGVDGERLSMTLPGGGTWSYAYQGAQEMQTRDDRTVWDRCFRRSQMTSLACFAGQPMTSTRANSPQQSHRSERLRWSV